MLQPLGTRLLARSGASSRIALSVPTGRCLHSTRTPRSTHALDSAVRAERHGAGGARWSAKKRYGTAAGALAFAAVGTAYLTSESTSDIPLLSPNVNPNDPLSALEPSVLGRTSAHLTSASMSDLVRQWVVYAVSEQSMLVSAAPWIVGKLQWANENIPLVGPAVWSIFAFGMENTFYHVFVGGETVPGCAETVKTYAERGIGVMFNYSAEPALGSVRTLTGVDETAMKEITGAIGEAAKLTPEPTTALASPVKPALVAIKLSGLLHNASILARASLALTSSTTVVRGGRLPFHIPFPDSPELSPEDSELLDKLYEGLRGVASEARKYQVRLLLDAEQSWFQPAIDRFADLLSEEFNRVDASTTSSTPTAPVVYNTYQCYLRDAPGKIAAALEHATANGYSFGAKLVRGAYQESERKRHEDTPAFEAGEPCVVWGSKAETDRCYDECAALLEKRIVADLKKKDAGREPGVGVCLASHNGTSMKLFLQALRDDGLATEKDGGLAVDERLRGRVAFGQLMGMSDNLTISLVNVLKPNQSADPSVPPLVVKYVPYATLEQALPYFVRRANENKSILQGDPTSGRGGARDERRAVGKEIRSRLGLSF
ncbi:hypothetical protein BMF94_4553 [Rhodotorula taiwanensis]|uniref:Proline dehydrogenase n=1 Tax=Rhodotorula taiwanensis TaxID=741276 RepID=A0A2S5B6L5_9BASI|nr:hypothetical protein BMF94_4553 [Rhodotorula taiwanensis]